LAAVFLLAASDFGCIRKGPGLASPATEAELAKTEVDQKPSTAHFYVKGRFLYDRCGERVILRGINKMVIWTDPQGDTFSEIAKTGANTVRIVWTIKDHPGADQLDKILKRAEDARLIPIIELHDATGNLGKVPEVVDFWIRPEIVGVLKKHEQTLLVNIANEAGGSGVQVDEFVDTYRTAITRLRAAGLSMPLMIDAPQWGQNIDVLQAAAPALLRADPGRNLLFSAHMWWVQGAGSADPGSTKRITDELKESVDLGLPLVVAEFGHAGVGCSRFIDYKTILAETEKQKVGWLAWEWGPGNKDCAEMDMTTDGHFETLRGWGLEVAMTDPHSIQKTSKIPESVYRGRCARKIQEAGQ
jgi:mannan endo-1,4-beta-mannosidase